MPDDDIQKIALDRARSFRDEAPTTAAAAAKIILEGVKAERWRILVGDDAHRLDERVRQTPERAYSRSFTRASPRKSAGGWGEAGVVRRTILTNSRPREQKKLKHTDCLISQRRSDLRTRPSRGYKLEGYTRRVNSADRVGT